jgi:hypothetical protein
MTKRPKPHPARRARRIAGVTSVGGMLVLTGCMAAATTTKSSATSSSKSSSTATTATTATTSSSDDGESDDTRATTTTIAPAQAGSTASQANTSSHGS